MRRQLAGSGRQKQTFPFLTHQYHPVTLSGAVQLCFDDLVELLLCPRCLPVTQFVGSVGLEERIRHESRVRFTG
jgi:hypothetical protein